ncbi:MAG TPA: pilus (MSHA type) biogenesis protein MshL [Syntrophorhabdaceae bacterium]|nr:pilus (MSHA type) biogenesis protein MshL [Syntrophorhabdaceae bacterium]
MDKYRVKRGAMVPALLCLAFVFLVCSCSPSIKEQVSIKNEVQIPDKFTEKKEDKAVPAPPKTPDFVPATVDVSPLRTRIVDIVARKTPLRDILYAISNATSLNLVMEKGVDPETEVNMTLRNVTAEQALNTVFASVDYFYRIQDNLLVVSAVATKTFELGHPAMTQKYEVDVGGDILGGAMNITTSGSGGSSGGSGGGSGQATNIKGNVSQKIKSDDAAFNFWDSIEKSLASLLEQASPQQTAGQAAAGSAPLGQGYTVNRLTGTIYVTATKKNLQKVEAYINSLKKVMNRQVIIEAKIIEVQLTDNFQFGINWTVVDRYITTTAAGATRTTSSWTYATSNFLNPVAGATGPVFTITGNPSFGGAKADLTMVLNALQQQGNVRTLSNPKLNIMNGQTALLTVGRNQAYMAKIESTTSTGGGASTTTYTTEQNSILSGIMIGILPYVNENGEISLTITPITSDLIDLTSVQIGTPRVADIQLPTVDIRQLSTTVKVRNGDIVAIGGLISKRESLVDNQIPLIGNIPILGYLFKSRDKVKTNAELVVILQPVLVNM